MNKYLIFVFYLIFTLVVVAINSRELWIVLSGILLIFEWQIVTAALFGVKKEKRLQLWKSTRLASHCLYLAVLVGAFLAIKAWFPTAHSVGLIFLGIFFLGLKELSFKICKYKVLDEVKQ